ncbi:MAG: hypothetical protein JXA42_15355 [Anaerolineales bacterium]|nr:hypothetical protein [Anaerolineales bacterium]
MANHEASFRPSPLGGLINQVADWWQLWLSEQHRITRRVAVGAILGLALVAFELFNFDTTEYALENLLGMVSFASIRWSTILAIAFCSIDFAGLARLLTPEDERAAGGTLKPTHLLLLAWLLGGGMNALMTWWAISLALMGHNLGNELISREQLLKGVPIFVALLVWITRLLIIGSFVINSNRVAEAGKPIRRKSARRLNGRSLQRPESIATGKLNHAIPIREPIRQTTSSGTVRRLDPSAVPLRAGDSSSRNRIV